MQNHFDLLVTDVMPIYMIIPRYSHNYAFFYQLLDSNLFTHRNTYAIFREATNETYGPGSIFYHISSPSIFYLHLLLSNLYHENTKNIYLILLSLSDLTFGGREGIDNPFIALVVSSLFVCVGAWDF